MRHKKGDTNMRDPSIHITISDLAKVFKRMGVSGLDVYEIARLAKSYSAHSRTLLIDKKYAEKKVTKEIMDDNALYKYMYKLYALTVRSIHRFAPKRYKETDTRIVSLISGITHDAMAFCDINNFEQDEGFKKYLEIGLRKSPKLVVLSGSSEYIQEAYLASLELDNDVGNALELYKIYSDTLLSYTGQDYKIKSDSVMVKFKRAAAFCDESNIPYKSFIKALFEGLEWKTGIPSPTMFSSDYGLQLVYEYLGKYGTNSADDGFKTISLKNIRDGATRD